MAAPAESKPERANASIGVMLGIVAAVALSSGGLLLRSIESATGWQILVYRSAAFALLLFALIVIQNRGCIIQPFRDIGWTGVLIAFILGTGFGAYVFAILNTTVANAMFVLACAPVFAALLGWIILGERVRPVVWLIIAVSLVGVGIMVASDLSPGRLAGNIFALIAAVTFALTVVLYRRAGDTDMLPATCLGGCIAFLVALTFAESLTLTQNDILISILLGTVQVGIGFICLTYAPRYILAAEVTLLTMLEPVLAPLWVWLVYNEVPSQATLIGGGIVMACVVAFAIVALRDQRRAG